MQFWEFTHNFDDQVNGDYFHTIVIDLWIEFHYNYFSISRVAFQMNDPHIYVECSGYTVHFGNIGKSISNYSFAVPTG